VDEGGPVPGAQAEFRRRDRNGDGRLDLDEMDEDLRAERDRWDANGDGFIDLAEFKNYLRARRARERETVRVGVGWPTRPPRAPPAADLHPKLPPWFREYDSDGDGQVSLYEWRAAGQPIDKFLAMDFNGDGFLTPDEVLPPEEVAPEPKEKKGSPKPEPQSDPGSLTAFQKQVGQVFAFTVTGAANGAVWGSDVYTADSTLARAAVHAGVLAVGQTGTVRVRIVAPLASFTGSTANGVTTRPYGTFPGAYQIVK
jgi:Ca2+-binding EF-hand superfamily protein